MRIVTANPISRGGHMDDLKIFSIGSQRLEWISTRSTVIASNIANTDTPGFHAKDIQSFESFLDESGGALRSTHAVHFGESGIAEVRPQERPSDDKAIKHSGNTVSLEAELVKVGELRSQHSLTTTVLSSFHKMFLLASKG